MWISGGGWDERGERDLFAKQGTKRRESDVIHQETSGSRQARGLPAVGTVNSDLSSVSLVRSWYREFRGYMPTSNCHPEAMRGAIRTAESTLGLLVILDMISQRNPATAPLLSQIIGKTPVPSSRDLCLAARGQIRCPILRAVLDPCLFGDNRKLPRGLVEQIQAAGTAARFLEMSERPATPFLLSLLHQVATGMAVGPYHHKGPGQGCATSIQRQNGIYYTPDTLSQYLAERTETA